MNRLILILLAFLPLFVGAQNKGYGISFNGNSVAYGNDLSIIDNTLLDFWTVSSTGFTYEMSIRGASGDKLYLDWGDGSPILEYTYTGGEDVITHIYTSGVYTQKWLTNETGIRTLIARGQNLTGELPIYMQKFTSLITLLIDNNSFNSDLDLNNWGNEIAKFISLDLFYIYDNNFSGSDVFLTKLTTLTGLLEFRAFRNNFTFTMSGLASISTCASIRYFNIFGNDCTGNSGELFTLSSWVDIQFFSISTNTAISGIIDNTNVASWSELETYLIPNNNITGTNDLVNAFFENRIIYTSTPSVQVQNNSELLTGIYQQPDIGTFTGDINDLAESEIINLSVGNDYDGNGTNIAWSILEKVWILENIETSSTNTVLRYGFEFTY